MAAFEAVQRAMDATTVHLVSIPCGKANVVTQVGRRLMIGFCCHSRQLARVRRPPADRGPVQNRHARLLLIQHRQ